MTDSKDTPTFGEAITCSDPDMITEWHLERMTCSEQQMADIYERLLKRCMDELKTCNVDVWECGLLAADLLLRERIAAIIGSEN